MRFCILPIASVHTGMIALPSIQSRTTARTADYLENRRAQHRPRTTREEKFAAKSAGWLKTGGDKLEVDVKHGKWVLSHLPAKPRSAPPPVEHYFPTE
jgi:hypothetical protein